MSAAKRGSDERRSDNRTVAIDRGRLHRCDIVLAQALADKIKLGRERRITGQAAILFSLVASEISREHVSSDPQLQLVPWFAAVETPQGEQDLTGLAP
jgi:hypothetical protein